jgi:GT2 family glycosyltransferase
MATAGDRSVAADLPGLVIIGRNEGERLKRCLASVQGSAAAVVYVDSGSTDGSVEWARSAGAEVVELDLSKPFTAARARNQGFKRLFEMAPELRWVQFVDGDCEVVSGWLSAATGFLQSHPDVAAVCGRRRERHPERSVYNRMCDREWDTPVGQAKACGGDVMLRTEALRAVGGYRDGLIAGEEPELCVRLRAVGWKVWRIAEEMTVHDAAMTRIGQWWRRSRRAGYAYAEGAALHGAPPERHWVHETRRALTWGVGFPLLVAISGAVATPWCLLLLTAYPLQIARLWMRGTGPGWERLTDAFFSTLGKFPEAQGALDFLRNRLLRRGGVLIEYK